MGEITIRQLQPTFGDWLAGCWGVAVVDLGRKFSCFSIFHTSHESILDHCKLCLRFIEKLDVLSPLRPAFVRPHAHQLLLRPIRTLPNIRSKKHRNTIVPLAGEPH
jgi:hypothetical protein